MLPAGSPGVVQDTEPAAISEPAATSDEQVAPCTSRYKATEITNFLKCEGIKKVLASIV